MTEILTSRTFQPGPDLTPLRDRIDGDVVGPGDYAWDEVRQAWNLSVDQRPAAVALPESPEDVMAIVAFAKANDLRVAPQGTGHGAAALDRLDGHDPAQDRADAQRHDRPGHPNRARRGGRDLDRGRRGGGEHGLAALAGSSPDVGVVGYTLGGGSPGLHGSTASARTR